MERGNHFGTGSFFNTVLFRIDTIMLGVLASEREVGLYSVAFNLMEGTFFIPTIVMAAIFPRLSQVKHFSAYFRKGVLLNVLLNFWLIPEHGASGAAVATVITEALILLSCFIMILKYQLSSAPAHVS